MQGPFLISLSVQGNLDSQSNETLISEVEGTTTIISIVAEGTIVSKGDIVCELDSSPLREKAKQQEITVTQAEAAMAQAVEALEIQKKQNESDISAAKLKWDLAQLDLEKYIDGEYPQLEKQLNGNVALAEEELLRVQENQTFTKEQVKKGYRTQNELDAARIAVKQAELKLQGAKEELKVLVDFTKRRTEAELKANAKEFELELERTKLKAKAAETQYQKDVEARKLTYEVELERFKDNKEQIEACILKAPQNGEVVYASMSSSRRSSEPVNIEEGATIRERQAIINLPDVTMMKVDCRIHESLIGSIRKGLPARIRIDAYPGQFFNGVVETVSSVPMAGSWPNTDLREYATEIHLTDEVEKIRKLRPGLTAQVEILVDNRADVLQVPIQSIVTVAGKQYSFVINKRGRPERRDVKIGESNQSHVEILDGIEEGEQVVMNPQSRFEDEIGELEAELASKKEGDGLSDLKPPPPPKGGDKPKEQKGKGGENTAKGPPGGFDPAAIISRLDKDGDGQISKEEASGQMKSRFDAMDSDKNGKISKAEFSAAAKKRQ